MHFYTMTESDRIYAVIEARRRELGLSQAQVSERAFGRSDTSAIQNIRRGSSPSAEKLSALSEALDLEFYFGPRKSEHEFVNMLQKQHAELFAPTSPVLAAESAQELHDRVIGQDFDPIPRYDVFLAAGIGAVNDENTPVEHLAFSKKWLKRMNIEPGMAALLSVKGESMEPTLFDGDLVLVDRNRFAVQSGKIYAFVDGDDGARVKRLRLFGNAGLVIQSDSHSSEFEDEERSGQDMQSVLDNIIGEVLWSGHTWD